MTGEMEMVTYIGMGARGWTIEVKDVTAGFKTYRFRIMVPRMVPGPFARKLCEKPFFLLGDESPLHVAQESLPKGSTVAFHRFGALGDLLMLHAILRPLRAHCGGLQFELCARDDMSDIFRYDPTYSKISRYGSENTAQAIIPLDGVLEVDHSSDEEDQHHRVDLFQRFLLRGFEPMPKLKIDWTLPTSGVEEEFARTWFRTNIPTRDRPVIALQTHGSGPMKTLDPPVVEAMAKDLAAEDYEVILLGQEPQFKALASHDRIHHPKAEVLCVLEIMKRCDAAVTMDSGLLWLAHNAHIPTVCILGPTRERERLTLHPLYEEGKVGSVNLAEAVGCRPCFERATQCQWKFRCMRAPSKTVVPLVRNELKRILS